MARTTASRGGRLQGQPLAARSPTAAPFTSKGSATCGYYAHPQGRPPEGNDSAQRCCLCKGDDDCHENRASFKKGKGKGRLSKAKVAKKDPAKDKGQCFHYDIDQH
ncbi:hypothetical protein BHE74_00007783 [Ensete ventricosum]|nr:hypothetical protein BHE74_00007783 [Ensete ventricosum]